jgi:hypothetical protein
MEETVVAGLVCTVCGEPVLLDFGGKFVHRDGVMLKGKIVCSGCLSTVWTGIEKQVRPFLGLPSMPITDWPWN